MYTTPRYPVSDYFYFLLLILLANYWYMRSTGWSILRHLQRIEIIYRVRQTISLYLHEKTDRVVSKALHVITFTFLRFFLKIKKRDFLRFFLLCCIRFLEVHEFKFKRSFTFSIFNKKDGYRQQNVRQRQKLISIIDYDCLLYTSPSPRD